MSKAFAPKGQRIKRNGGPYPLKPRSNKRESWFYTNRGSIDVCIYQPGIGTDMTRISLKTLRRIVHALDGVKP